MFDFSDTHLPIRQDIKDAYRDFWQRLAKPGNWWNGAERVAIAEASREALDCEYCKARKQALSPYNFSGEHLSSVDLPARAVDAVHRIITDQNRITRKWVESNAEAGFSKERYVELVGIVVATFSIDEFHRGLGIPLEPLPEPLPGEPDGYRPAVLVEDMGFVPTIPPEGAVGNEADLWQNGATANVLRALTLVPQALRDWLQISSAQYLSIAGMGNFVKEENRSINRMQMELVAGRVSSYNECFY
jgi:hypothetical protein